MISDTQKNQYGITTYSNINYDKHDEWSIDEWLAKGNQVLAVEVKPYVPGDNAFRKAVQKRIQKIKMKLRNEFIAEVAGVSATIVKNIALGNSVAHPKVIKVKNALNRIDANDPKDAVLQKAFKKYGVEA